MSSKRSFPEQVGSEKGEQKRGDFVFNFVEGWKEGAGYP